MGQLISAYISVIVLKIASKISALRCLIHIIEVAEQIGHFFLFIVGLSFFDHLPI